MIKPTFSADPSSAINISETLRMWKFYSGCDKNELSDRGYWWYGIFIWSSEESDWTEKWIESGTY